MKIPTGSTLYFDTNIFRSLNDDECNELQQLTAAKNIKCICPPRVLMELLSHINSDEKDRFKYYQTAFRKQKAICSFCILPHHQHVLVDYFGLSKPLDELIPLGDFIQTRGHILNSEGYDEFLEKMRPVQDTVSGKLMPYENFWHYFLENYETVWVDTVASLVDNLISSGLESGIPKAPTDKDNEAIRKVLYSLESKRGFLNMMIQVAGGKCPNELSASRVDELLKPIEACFSAFMKILEGNIKKQYGPKRLKNDWNDLELLEYLGLKNHFFITNDKKLREKVDDSYEQKKRILTFDDAIEKLSD